MPFLHILKYYFGIICKIIVTLNCVYCIIGTIQTFGCNVISLENEDGIVKGTPGKMIWKLDNDILQESDVYTKVNLNHIYITIRAC